MESKECSKIWSWWQSGNQVLSLGFMPIHILTWYCVNKMDSYHQPPFLGLTHTPVLYHTLTHQIYSLVDKYLGIQYN